VRGKAFDVNLGRGGQTLGAQHIEARLAAVGILARRQAVFAPRLV